MSQDNNWKVEFQDAASNTVFEAEGYKNPMTMDLVTEDSFVHLGLVQMAHRDHGTQSMGCDVIPLSDSWKKAVVTSEEFGLDAVEVTKTDFGQDGIIAAQNQAYTERKQNGEDDLFPDMFDID